MTTPANNASFYADFGSLAALKRDARTDSPQALRAAAQQFESLFTNMMLKSMRAASFGDALTGSSDVEFYQGMFDQQLAVQMSKGRGMGLADMLVQQLTRSGLAGSAGAQAATTLQSSATAAASIATQASGTTTGSDRQALLNAVRAVLDAQAGAASGDSDSLESFALPDSLQAQSMPDFSTATNVDAASAQQWPPTSPADFVRQMLPQAQAAASKLGVDATTLVAHAALETGWGKHVPCAADGSSSFNLFGIKAGSDWQGGKLDASTLEFEQGAFVRKVERFKAYDSPADCFEDYAQLLGNARRYATARNAGSDSLQFAQGLQRGGYATDPDYASKLHAVANAVQSLQFAGSQVPATSADI